MKDVAMIIRVPSGPKCWEGTMQGESCECFDNEGGHAHCTLGFVGQRYDRVNSGVFKSPECAKLQEVKHEHS